MAEPTELSLTDFDDSWSDIEAAPPGPPPDGQHRARLVSLEAMNPISGAPALRGMFELLDSPHSGKRASQVIAFSQPPAAKWTLAALGLADVRPSALPSFRGFDTLEPVRITTRVRESEGRAYCNVVRIEPIAEGGGGRTDPEAGGGRR